MNVRVNINKQKRKHASAWMVSLYACVEDNFSNTILLLLIINEAFGENMFHNNNNDNNKKGSGCHKSYEVEVVMEGCQVPTSLVKCWNILLVTPCWPRFTQHSSLSFFTRLLFVLQGKTKVRKSSIFLFKLYMDKGTLWSFVFNGRLLQKQGLSSLAPSN